MSRDNTGRAAAPSRKGFTLLELMVVIVILGILVGIVAPRFMDEPHKARVVKAKMQIENLSTALKRYYIDNGYYPTTEQGLEALVRRPSSGKTPREYPDGGYISKIPLDPWGNPYVYVSPGDHNSGFDLSSRGADGEEGGSGDGQDVQSWNLD